MQDIYLAYSVGIDAFALNIANGWEYNEAQVALAFSVAEAQPSLYGFKLYFSFNYAGGGAWDEEDVISMISAHSSSSAYYQYNGKPFVSTFEGPGNAEDWINIKSKTGCFFVPNWSSSGATVAVDLAGGVADGLFSESKLFDAVYVDIQGMLILDQVGLLGLMATETWTLISTPRIR